MKIVIHVNPVLKELIAEFLDSLRNSAAAIREALAKMDYETIRIQAHQMKGTGGGFGFHDVSAIGEQLERAARAQHPGEIENQLERLVSFLDRVEVVYDPEKPAESR